MTDEQNPDIYTLLTRQEAADYLGFKRSTLAVWASKKINLRFIKVGRLVKYRLSDLKEFIDKGSKEPEQNDTTRK